MEMQPTTVFENSTTSSTSDNAPNVHGQWVLAFEFIFHGLISILGTLGNVLVFKAILSQKKRKVSDYLILNLSATDLGACAISIPLDLVERAWKSFPFGKLLCNIVYPFQTILMSVSVTTLLAMSFERYRLIITPFKRRIRARIAIGTIIISWAISVLLVVPYMMVLNLQGDHCVEQWPDPIYGKAFTLSVFLVLYLLPLLVIVGFYTLIIRNMYQDSQRQFSEYFQSSANRSALQRRMTVTRVKRNMRVVRVFMSAGIAFAVCMLPTHVCWLWHDFGSGSTSPHFSMIVTFSNVLTYLNSAIDPFIFGSLGLQRLCLDVICCRVCQSETHFRLRSNTKGATEELVTACVEREMIYDKITSV